VGNKDGNAQEVDGDSFGPWIFIPYLKEKLLYSLVLVRWLGVFPCLKNLNKL
ncbi:hypothetical protein CCACVL1_00495, partial [Corchorus capsularis]